jgi:hypothetical protein
MPDPAPFRPLDHAAAHERLADLGLEADGLERLEASSLPDDRALLDHLRGCSTCQSEVAASTSLRDALRIAFQALPDVQPLDRIEPSAALRGQLLAAVRREPKGPMPRPVPVVATATVARFSRWPAAIAAALIVALLGGAVGLQLGRQANDDGTSMAAVVATVDRVLGADPHWVVPLKTASGAAAGSVSWSRQDFAVLTTALTHPAAGRTYRCWLEWDGRWAEIGEMDFQGTLAYWTGSVADWATLNVGSGSRFVVTLDPAGGATPATGPTTPVVLSADLTD